MITIKKMKQGKDVKKTKFKKTPPVHLSVFPSPTFIIILQIKKMVFLVSRIEEIVLSVLNWIEFLR